MPSSRILLGVIGRPHGVRGLVHITSHTADPAALAEYGPLSDRASSEQAGRTFTLVWKGDGIAELTELKDGARVRVSDRDAAARLTNTRLHIDRAQLPPPEADEFYLADLIGLQAVDQQGNGLGPITAVHDHGAGAFLEIGPTTLIPFTQAAVPEIDLPARRVTVVPPTEVEATSPLPLRARAAERTKAEGWGDRGTGSNQATAQPDPRPPTPAREGRGSPSASAECAQ
jgi:16S rRNA processing protein RimM